MTGSVWSMELQFRAALDVSFGVVGAAYAPLEGVQRGEGVGSEPQSVDERMTGSVLRSTFRYKLRGTFHSTAGHTKAP